MRTEAYFEDKGKKSGTIPTDPFFTEINMAKLDESDRQIREGRIIVKAMEELEAMELE